MSLGVGKQVGEVVAVPPFTALSLELSSHLLSLRATTAPPSRLRSYTTFRAFASTFSLSALFLFSPSLFFFPSVFLFPHFLSLAPRYLCASTFSRPRRLFVKSGIALESRAHGCSTFLLLSAAEPQGVARNWVLLHRTHLRDEWKYASVLA